MTKAEELFHKIAVEMPECTESKMFGALCIKAPNGKAGVMFKNEEIIFKLAGTQEMETLALEGARTFDPKGGRPMTGWIQVPYMHAAKWQDLAKVAMENVKQIEVVKKAKK